LPKTIHDSGAENEATVAAPGRGWEGVRPPVISGSTPELPFLSAGAVAPGGSRYRFHPRQRWVWKRAKLLAITAAAVLLTYTFIGEASVVPTGSMEGTILVGDHLIVNKLLYGPRVPFTRWRLPRMRTVKRGNIIAFVYPKDPSLTFLKRVAAVGGDKVEIRRDVLYINDAPVSEPYVVHRLRRGYARPEDMPAQLIPEDSLFVLGDNRDNSDDSRYWGTVPEENVIGEPLMVLWSYDAPSRDWLDEDPMHQVKFFASIMANLFTRTRWSRTGALL
jgi:signal peptidase I